MATVMETAMLMAKKRAMSPKDQPPTPEMLPSGAPPREGYDGSEFGPLDLGQYGWFKKTVLFVILSPFLVIAKVVDLIRR